MRLLRVILFVLVALVIVAAVAVRFVVVPQLDADMNAVAPGGPWPVSAEAQALHDTLLVADLHADTTLWARNPAKRHDYGHVDLPRMREGNMALQLFTSVTKSPEGQNYEHNEGGTDRITTLAMAQWWPVDTWGSLEARARYQARRLQRLERQDPNFRVIRTRSDVIDLIADRRENKALVGGLIGFEGAHALDGDLEAIDRLYTEGFRSMGLHHFFDNKLGGSLHGVSQEGLSQFGYQALARMEELSVIIDLAHSSEAVVRDVLAATDRPVILSHTGINSLCPGPRNISDELMAQIASGGGLIGIGFWDDAICDATPDGVAQHIKAAVDLFGEDAIALGSDFDGTVTTYFDASDMAAVTDALLRAGVAPPVIAKVMGGNQMRFLSEHLPE